MMMGFEVNLLQTLNRVNDLNKTYLVLKSSVDCTATGAIAPDEMNLLIDLDGFDLNCNYCQIPLFNRFYFLKYQIEGNLVRCALTSDPIVSFKSDVLNADVIAERSSSNFEKYLADGYVKNLNISQKSIARFKNVFATGETGAHYVIRIGGR